MVADNKQPNPSAETSPVAKVGGKSRANSLKDVLGWARNNKKRSSIAVIIIVLVVGWAHFGLHIGEKVYAQAAGHKIYKHDINDLIDNTKGITDRQAATVLANKYLYEAMAKKAEITVTNKDIVAQYPDVNAKSTTKFARQSDINNVYYNQLSAYNTGLYKGELIATNFSRYIAFQSSFATAANQGVNNPLMGNQTAIDADKKYAQNLITSLYDQIKSGKVTFDQAIQIEHNDPRVGLKVYPTLAHSGPFNTSNVYLGATALLAPQSIQPKIAGMKTGQLSKPFAVSVSNSTGKANKSTVDSYYLIVHMDYTKGSHTGLTFAQYLAKAKRQYGYRVYV
jgi:hypothetical protein